MAEPKRLTTREMIVVYDFGRCTSDPHRRESTIVDLRASANRPRIEGPARMRATTSTRMRAPWNDASSWWMTVS